MKPPSVESISVDLDGAVGSLTLNRPGALNALSGTMLEELTAAADWFDRSPARTVVISGAGRVFSAGADVQESLVLLDHLNDDPTSLLPSREAVAGEQMGKAIRSMRAITVAGAHGTVVGGAAVLLAACDIRVLGESTSILLPEIELGLPLAWGGIAMLFQDLGPGRLKRLLLTGEPLSASEAVTSGFAAAAVPEAEVVATARRMASTIAAHPPAALRGIKDRINRIAAAASLIGTDLGDADDYAAALRDPETLAAITAYMNKFR